MLSRELRTYLGRRLCGDVAKIIEEYVVGQAKRVSRLLNVIESVAWAILDKHADGFVQMNVKCISYKFGEERYVYLCNNCGTVQHVTFYDKCDWLTEMWQYWDCGDCCIDDALFVDEAEPVKEWAIIGEDKIKFCRRFS
nr:hypothetical protein K-LCC10_0003 [Kaumoebavirus]